MGNKYIINDIKVAIKIEENKEYYEKLEIANKIIEIFNITKEISFYKYAQVIKELNNINYYDTQAFTRFQNKEYYDLVKQQIKTKPKIKIVK